MTQITTLEDLVVTLTGQHEDLKKLLPKVLESQGDDRADAFAEVRRTLAAHEALEQGTVHPAARSEEGDGAADPRLEEEHEAEQAIARLESLDVDSEEFAEGFEALSKDVVEHAENEEHKEWEGLSGELTDVAVARVAAGLELVKDAQDGSLKGATFQEMFTASKERIKEAG
jgi:hemerythrin superfamily protein